jgi:hypothetical protein
VTRDPDSAFRGNIPTSMTSGIPYHVPCPPSAPRLPPPVYRETPNTKSGKKCQIPSPPRGARVPGDRIAWSPLEFPKAIEKEEYFSEPEIVLVEITHDSDLLELPLDRTVVERDANVDQVTELPDSEEDVTGGVMESPEDDSNTEEIGETGEAEGTHLDGLVANRGTDSASSPKQIPLAGDSIQIDALADLIGIKSYQVLKELIKMEIFAKATDLIHADTASEIASAYGFEVIPGILPRRLDRSGEESSSDS